MSGEVTILDGTPVRLHVTAASKSANAVCGRRGATIVGGRSPAAGGRWPRRWPLRHRRPVLRLPAAGRSVAPQLLGDGPGIPSERAGDLADTPTASAASSVDSPAAISRQNSRCTARDGAAPVSRPASSDRGVDRRPADALLYARDSGARLRGTLSGFFVAAAIVWLLALAAVGRFGSADIGRSDALAAGRAGRLPG